VTAKRSTDGSAWVWLDQICIVKYSHFTNRYTNRVISRNESHAGLGSEAQDRTDHGGEPRLDHGCRGGDRPSWTVLVADAKQKKRALLRRA
jgi:hypothetical protein